MQFDQKPFYTIVEFAVRLGVHPNTVRKSIKEGRIAAFKVGLGKKSCYRIADSEFHRMAELHYILRPDGDFST